MSQTEIPSSAANITRTNWSEITPQHLYDKCMALARNLWWSWHPEVVNLFRDLDPVRWRQIDHNPIALLAEMTPDQVAERASELVLYTRINQAHRRLKEAGETLSVVVGDPAYYGRFGYERGRAEKFDSEYQGDAMQAQAWGDAPAGGRLVYSKAFGSL